MAYLLRMPEIAANATEAVLQAWTISEGATFNATDVIANIETEKALVDLEAENDGVLVRTLVAPGASVEIGQPIAVLAANADDISDIDSLLAGIAVAAPPPAEQTEVEVATDADAEPTAALALPDAPRPRIFASPIARKMARDNGLALDQLVGSGPNGRILRADVESALSEPTRPAAVTQSAPVTPTRPVLVGSFAEVPHSRMRRAIAARLSLSKQTIPHFYVRGTARVDKLLALRELANAGRENRLSVNDFVVKAVAAAHMACPTMNVTWGDDALRAYRDVDIAIAIATDGGLVTPVVRAANQLSVSEIAVTIRDFAARARAGQLKQDELEGGAISITNLGMYGTEEFAAIINPPQSAIIAIGGIRKEPVVVGDAIEIGEVMHVTLSVDHRPIDGVVAAEWMRGFIEILQNPVRMLV